MIGSYQYNLVTGRPDLFVLNPHASSWEGWFWEGWCAVQSLEEFFLVVAEASLYASSFGVAVVVDRIWAGCKLHPVSIGLGSASIGISVLDMGYVIYRMKTDPGFAQGLSKFRFWGTAGAAIFNVIFYSSHFGICK